MCSACYAASTQTVKLDSRPGKRRRILRVAGLLPLGLLLAWLFFFGFGQLLMSIFERQRS